MCSKYKKEKKIPSWLCVPAAQTVELSDCEKTQALALQVLLSLTKFNQHRIHEMDCYHGYSMIHQVLIKSKCIVGYHVLKVSHTFNSPTTEIIFYFSLETHRATRFMTTAAQLTQIILSHQ